jgi:pimeloyl-ACP methyl ester carboxylesterase
MPVQPVRLDQAHGAPPTLLFTPPGGDASLPLILVGHGAHLSKDDPEMQVLAKAFCCIPAAVALMDCPGHGERRAPDVTDDLFDREVGRRLSDPQNYARVRDDWNAVESAARVVETRIAGKTGYAGFSMGAIFGLSIVADLPSVAAAVFALGGITRDETRNGLIRDGARRLGDREVLMVNMTRDEHFPIEGAIELFETIPGPKRMGVWSGTHAEVPPEAMELAVAFFRRTLAS